ncbi:hypothetical protein MTR_0328s0010 [Medicago truncatula]|uniref:Uncharacterized protein n=1 Tax=Medicago truncatula TaxID=3880 RepID=A0A072TRA2_MEDTR|nr:hypothetical protein MTR_0328s0010 [Medicago truncatula]
MRYFKIPPCRIFYTEKSEIDQSRVTSVSEALGQKLGYDKCSARNCGLAKLLTWGRHFCLRFFVFLLRMSSKLLSFAPRFNPSNIHS